MNRRSIDGISPLPKKSSSAKPIYIARRQHSTAPQKLVSIQPSQRLNAQPIVKRPLNPHYVRGTVSDILPPKLIEKPADTRYKRVSDFGSKEVVVKLPRKLSIRASISLVAQYILIAVVAVIAAYSTLYGQWFVLVFGAVVLITRKDSSLTFGTALFILVTVPLFQFINQPGVANNMAVYVYELLVIGTVQALIELKTKKL